MPMPADPAPNIAIVCSRQRNAGRIDRGQQRGRRDRSGSLDVVVEGAEPIAIALQQPRRIRAGEIFPLQQNVRPASLHGGDECFDEVVVLLPAHAMVLPADVDRIAEQRFVVGSRIEQNRQAMLRRNSAERGVERHLPDGDAHAAGALVAEAENALAIADHDAAHIVVARVGENLIDPIPIGIADEQSARPAPDF